MLPLPVRMLFPTLTRCNLTSRGKIRGVLLRSRAIMMPPGFLLNSGRDPATDWQRGLISNFGFVAPPGSEIDVTADAVGAFIFRSADGIGNVNFTNVQLQWNYGGSGIPDEAVIEICVMAVEMVYIPEGSYSLGDDSPNPVGTFEAGNSSNPFLIPSENALTLGGTLASNLSNNNAIDMLTADDYNYTTTQALPAAYPKGFNPFYIQKYEVSQAQYVAFLNKLPATATVNRFANQTGNNGHNIDDNGVPPETYVTTTPDYACNFIPLRPTWRHMPTGVGCALCLNWSMKRPAGEAVSPPLMNAPGAMLLHLMYPIP